MSLSLLAGLSAYHGIRYVFFPPKKNVVIKMEPLEYKELLYTILGKNRKRAYELQDKLYELLEVFGQPK